MEENKKTSYEISYDEAEKLVKTEVATFRVLKPMRKCIRLGSYIKQYVKAQKALSQPINRKNETYRLYKTKQLQNEYLEMLSAIRVKSFAGVMDDSEKELFVMELKKKYDSALNINDSQELLKIYDYIRAACFLVSDAMSGWKEDLENLRESCDYIIEKAYGLTNENER